MWVNLKICSALYIFTNHTHLHVFSTWLCRDENEPEKIVDSEATKPDGWLEDENKLVPDPDAEKPKDW